MVSAPHTRSNKSAGPKKRSPRDPAKEALQHFRLIFKSVKKHFRWVEQQTGVNGAQFWVLAAIVDNPGLKVTELAAVLSVHQSRASNLIAKLVRQKFLRRERSEEDQRIVRLFPEAKGIAIVKAAPKPIRGVLPDALRRLSALELNQLNLLLSSVVRKMKVRDATGKATPLANI